MVEFRLDQAFAEKPRARPQQKFHSRGVGDNGRDGRGKVERERGDDLTLNADVANFLPSVHASLRLNLPFRWHRKTDGPFDRCEIRTENLCSTIVHRFLFLAERRVLEGLLNNRWWSYLIRIEGKALEICEANVWIKVK